MIENIAPSGRKYSDDPSEQAYCAHVEHRTLKLGDALIRLLRGGRCDSLAELQDFVWEQALDFVAPLEPATRDELRRAETGLPWAGRGEVELYWRLMYAAHAEKLIDDHSVISDDRAVRRPLKDVVAVATTLLHVQIAAQEGKRMDFISAFSAPGSTPIGHAFYQGIIDRAGREIRLRAGLRRAPKPLEPFLRVRVGGVACEVSGYGLRDGTVTVTRETEPVGDGRVWTLDARRGRWRADVPPWQIETPS